MGDWFHTIYSEDNTWSKYHWSSLLNTGVMTDEEVADLRASMSQSEFDQEILALFVTKSGRVYSDFDEHNEVDDFIPTIGEYEICMGMDFGYAAPTAVGFFAIDKFDNVYQFDELYVARTQINGIIDLIRDKLNTYNISIDKVKACYTDPAGEAYELRVVTLQWIL